MNHHIWHIRILHSTHKVHLCVVYGSIFPNGGIVYLLIDLSLQETSRICLCFALYGAETWTLWTTEKKYLKSFEM